MKSENEVIEDFSSLVNMTASELESWLKSGDSKNAGWSKDEDDGESVGHESGRKIIKILESNPQKKPDKYTDDQIAHMRKVVSYCKRHLAQESHGNEQKSTEEVKKTKSYASLKNWGHDILKKKGTKESDSPNDEKHAGDKRQHSNDSPKQNKQAKTTKKSSPEGDESDKRGSSSSESRETRSTTKRKGSSEEDHTSHSSNDDDNNDDDKSKKSKQNKGKQGEQGIKEGDTVSWKWGGGHPEGKVLDVRGDDTEITTHKGNKVTRKGTSDDPAVVIDSGKSKAVKKAHELD